jgi:Lipocalin-like domain
MPSFSPLGVNVFTAPEKAVVDERPRPFGPPLAWDPTTSTLIFGALGEDAQGFLIYSDDGYTSAQLMRCDRAAYDKPSGAGGTTEQSAAAARGYLAYSGPFDVDEETGTVRHHASISLYPTWVGTDQVRHADLCDGFLTRVADIGDGLGPTARAVLTWRRPE